MSGTEYAPDTSIAWTFYFDFGDQSGDFKTDASYAWAVRDGDVSIVPIPAAAWLLGSALAVAGVLRRFALSNP